jgi:hypothetical protein
VAIVLKEVSLKLAPSSTPRLIHHSWFINTAAPSGPRGGTEKFIEAAKSAIQLSIRFPSALLTNSSPPAKSLATLLNSILQLTPASSIFVRFILSTAPLWCILEQCELSDKLQRLHQELRTNIRATVKAKARRLVRSTLTTAFVKHVSLLQHSSISFNHTVRQALKDHRQGCHSPMHRK